MTNKKVISTISRTYAQALIDSIPDAKDYANFEKQLTEITQVFESSDDLKIVLTNSSIPTSKK